MPEKKILEFIVDEFRATEVPLTLDEIARRRGVDKPTVEKEIRASERLSDFRGLRPEQALKVIEFYGQGAIFNDLLERSVEEFQSSKAKLDEMDRRFDR